MKEVKKLKQKVSKISLASGIFVPCPERTFEWLGGVNYENLDKAFSRVKELMIGSPDEEIHMLVSSPGGQTGVGMSFYDAAKSWLKPNLVTIGSGDVDSAGILLFCAGRTRYLTKNTTLLLHPVNNGVQNASMGYTIVETEEASKEDKVKDNQYAQVISDTTGGRYSKEDILQLMNTKTVLTADDAFRMGLAHKVLD